MLWWPCRAPLALSPRCRFTSVSLQFETVFIFHCCPLSHTRSLPPRASFHLFNKREALQAGESFKTKLKLLLGLNKNVFVPYQGAFSPIARHWLVLFFQERLRPARGFAALGQIN